MYTVPVILAAATLAVSRAIPLMRRDLNFGGGSGDGTFYNTGLGACGVTNTDTDMIAAIGHEFFDQYATHMGDHSGNPNKNPICNKKVKATYQGKSVVVAITDRCGGCDIPYSLDFSPSAFSQLADQSVGRIHGMTWTFVDGDGAGNSTGSGAPPTTSAVGATSTPAAPGAPSMSSSAPSAAIPSAPATPSAPSGTTTDSTDDGDDGDDSDDSDPDSSSSASPSSTSSTTIQHSESSESSTIETTETQ